MVLVLIVGFRLQLMVGSDLLVCDVGFWFLVTIVVDLDLVFSIGLSTV